MVWLIGTGRADQRSIVKNFPRRGVMNQRCTSSSISLQAGLGLDFQYMIEPDSSLDCLCQIYILISHSLLGYFQSLHYQVANGILSTAPWISWTDEHIRLLHEVSNRGFINLSTANLAKFKQIWFFAHICTFSRSPFVWSCQLVEEVFSFGYTSFQNRAQTWLISSGDLK